LYTNGAVVYVDKDAVVFCNGGALYVYANQTDALLPVANGTTFQTANLT